MAKKTTEKAETTEKTPKPEAPKYSITDLAEALDITPAAARVKLRQNKVEKNGGRYGWDSKAELNEVVTLLKSTPKKSKKSKSDEGDED